MCGDFDDHDRFDDELFERFIELAGRFGVTPGQPGGNAPVQLTEEDARAAYMKDLFRAGLTRSLNDAANLPHGEHMDALAGQAIVFARLAGFLAGQFPPQTDLFRTVSGALLEGHGEPASLSQPRAMSG
jgi:ribose 5-phosphate isomerase RpiB